VRRVGKVEGEGGVGGRSDLICRRGETSGEKEEQIVSP